MAVCIMERSITALKAQRKNRQRVNVYLDGEFAFGLSRSVAAWLAVGQTLGEEKIAQLLKEDAEEVAYQRALRFLSYRVRSEDEVRKNLYKANAEDSVIELVVKRLQKNGLVDDQSFARQWVENRNEFRPRGRRALAYELRRKSIAPEIIDEVLEDLDEDKLAYLAAQKKAFRIKAADWQDFRKRLGGFLARKGFRYETIAPVLEKLWAERNGTSS